MSSLPPLLCRTAQLLSSALDSSFSAALLVTEDGTVVYHNCHATILLHLDFHSDDNEQKKNNAAPVITAAAHISDWIQQPEDTVTWEQEFEKLQSNDNNGRETLQCILVKSKQSVTVNLSRLAPCPDSQKVYISVFVKTESSKLSIDEVSALQLDKDLVDASFDPMFAIDEEGVIIMVNEATIKTFGYSYKELLHHNISLVCGGPHGDMHRKYMERYLATGESKIVNNVRTVPARRKDGTEFPVELGVKEVSSSDGIHKRLFVGYMKDMTSFVKHEKELLHKECLMQSMINASFDPMFQIDERGIICLVNNAAVNLFGYEREEFLGKNVSIICGDSDAPHHDRYMQNYLTSGQRKIIGKKRKVMAKRKDGSEFEVELGVQEVIVDDTGERMFCGYVRDMTQQRMVQKALRRKDAEMKGKFFGRE